jgi:surface carbohydrate biosynthesis protein (TIGR04326 family)
LTEHTHGALTLICDSSATAPGRGGPVYRWSGYQEDGQVCSLLRYVETHDQRLRARYLAWIHALGEARTRGQRVVDHLAGSDGLSFWWLTPLVEQSPWKSPAITDAIRLLALEEIVIASGARRMRLLNARPALRAAVGALCTRLRVDLEIEGRAAVARRRYTPRGIFDALPCRLRALLTLGAYLARRWSLRELRQVRWTGGERALFLCSYFFHLDQDSCARGRFHSRFWENLPEVLAASGYSLNWLQHYIRSAVVPSAGVARDLARRLNANPAEQAQHAFLDSFLSVRIVLRVLRRWLALSVLHRRLHAIGREAFTPPDSNCNLWPLLRGDWHDSLCGPTAMSNLLWAELFDAALRALPRQPLGLYLCENQGWERALIHAWRKHGHGRLIAVPHSTLRFWDLRYFKAPESLRPATKHALPLPDAVALNGRAAVEAYLQAGQPPDRLVECEALRYGYLSGLPRARGAPPGSPLRVLILGDYWQVSNAKMLRLLEQASARMATGARFAVKPHPNSPVNPADYPALRLEVLAEALPDILGGFDVAYSSNLTSAAVDAYLAGLPVVVMLDDEQLNFSPLRGRSGARFVSQPQELAEALQAPRSVTPVDDERAEFFFLDQRLPRWKQMIGLGSAAVAGPSASALASGSVARRADRAAVAELRHR